MVIQVDIRGHKICLCRQWGCYLLAHTADCPIRSQLLYHQMSFDCRVYKPADQLPDGLVVGAGAPVETVVVNWTASSRVIWRHWNNRTLELNLYVATYELNSKPPLSLFLFVNWWHLNISSNNTFFKLMNFVFLHWVFRWLNISVHINKFSERALIRKKQKVVLQSKRIFHLYVWLLLVLPVVQYQQDLLPGSC